MFVRALCIFGTLRPMPKGEYLQYGGQAIIEGVMMRSPRFFSIACRAPNGDIVIKTEAIEKTWIGKQKWLKVPFLRGALALLDSMALGTKALRFASDIQLKEEFAKPEDREKIAKENEGKKGSGKVQEYSVAVAMLIGLGFGIAIFQFIPNMTSAYLKESINYSSYVNKYQSDMLTNFVTEIIKIVLFLGYLVLISQMKEIKRVFEYHGAEHKAINVLEAEEELTMDNCRNQTRLHPRCGTSFAIIVLIVSLIIFTLIPRPQGMSWAMGGFVRFLIEIPLMFFIAGISYELLRFAGKNRDSGFVKALFAPGLMSQYLTTREPDNTQIEVALAALNDCMAAEEGGVVHDDYRVIENEESKKEVQSLTASDSLEES